MNLVSNTRSYWLAIGGILAFGLLVRIFALWHFSENLTDDRDSYLRIATHLSEGNGYSATGNSPTAFRPPLYPCLLAVGIKASQNTERLTPARWVGTLNLICSMLTVGLTLALANKHFDRRIALLAGMIAAWNPYLIYQVTLPMTETLFGLLAVGLVGSLSHAEPTRPQRIQAGIWFGLAALCRPTVWAFAGLLCCLAILTKSGRARLRQNSKPRLLTIFIAVALVAPWTIRNAIALNAFVPMTTHGGYTLLLGNNPVYYREVVEQSWRTTWKGESLNRWQNSLEANMTSTVPSIEGEVARNRWMTARAIENIREQPTMFLRSCVVRLWRFWNPVPLNSDDTQPSPAQQFVLCCFSGFLFLGLVLSIRGAKCRNRISRVTWILILSTTALHLIFWSNLRMRIPLEPLLGILSACGFVSLSRFSRENEESPAPPANA